MTTQYDIDIDVAPNVTKENYGKRIGIYNEEQLKFVPHPSGYVINETSLEDAFTGLFPVPFQDIDETQAMKVDLLTNTSYGLFSSKEEVLYYRNKIHKFDFSLLQKRDFVEQLPHISNHFYVLVDIQPQSPMQLADVLALIRPGKVHLIDQYKASPEKTRQMLYTRPHKGMYFKKSHATAYAVMILTVACRLSENRVERLFGL